MSDEKISGDLVQYRVVWCQCPHVHNVKQVLFIEARSAEDAKKIARDHVERKFGVEWFTIFEAKEAVAPPQGKVIG